MRVQDRQDRDRRLLRIAWPTVGAIVERVVADGLDPARLDDLIDIGVDEISWKKRHNYLTVVVDHTTGDVVWTGEGKDTAALDAFFAELGPDRAGRLRAISMDMGKAYPKSTARDGHAPQAEICWDPFHVVALGTKALDVVRRGHWNQLRASAAVKLSRRKGRYPGGERTELWENSVSGVQHQQAVELLGLQAAPYEIPSGQELRVALMGPTPRDLNPAN